MEERVPGECYDEPRSAVLLIDLREGSSKALNYSKIPLMLLIKENNYRVVLRQGRLTCTGLTVKHFVSCLL